MAESTLIQDKQFHRSADLIVKKYWKFFIPMLLTAMSGELALVVDSVLVGRYLGPTAMSAVSMSSSVETLIYAFAVLFSLGAEGLISIAMGSRNRAVADKYYTVVLFLETFFGFLIAAVGCLFIDPIISLITDEPEIITFLKPYLFITMLGIFPYLPMTGWNVVIQADGLPHITTISIAACQVVNLVLDIVLMKYCNMGPTGAAIATQTGYIVGILIQVFMYLPNKKRTLHWTGSVFGEMRSMCKKAWESHPLGHPYRIRTSARFAQDPHHLPYRPEPRRRGVCGCILGRNSLHNDRDRGYRRNDRVDDAYRRVSLRREGLPRGKDDNKVCDALLRNPHCRDSAASHPLPPCGIPPVQHA